MLPPALFVCSARDADGRMHDGGVKFLAQYPPRNGPRINQRRLSTTPRLFSKHSTTYAHLIIPCLQKQTKDQRLGVVIKDTGGDRTTASTNGRHPQAALPHLSLPNT